MPCLNEQTRDELIAKIEDVITDTDKAQRLAEFVNELPKCTVDSVGKGKKGERKLTAYNIFMSKCAKGTGRTFKECIQDYRDSKKK